MVILNFPKLSLLNKILRDCPQMISVSFSFSLALTLIVLCFSVCNCANFIKDEFQINLYTTEINSILQNYPQVFHDQGIDMKTFLIEAEMDHILKVLIGMRKVLPKFSAKLHSLEMDFFLLHFRSKSDYLAENLMRRKEIELLSDLIAKDSEIAFLLLQKIVKKQPASLLTDQIIQLVCDIYSNSGAFINYPIYFYKYGGTNHSYLLHQACSRGNIPAIIALIRNGADPKLLGGASVISLNRNALQYAETDSTGTESLILILTNFDWSADEKNAAKDMILVNYAMNAQLKLAKVRILTDSTNPEIH